MFGKIKSLQELFEIELGYAYDCEKKLVERGLPSMIENARSSELRTALEQHWRNSHPRNPPRTCFLPCSGSNHEPNRMRCSVNDKCRRRFRLAYRGFFFAGRGTHRKRKFRRAYEIALYGSLAAIAKSLGLHDAAQFLKKRWPKKKRQTRSSLKSARRCLPNNPANAKQQRG